MKAALLVLAASVAFAQAPMPSPFLGTGGGGGGSYAGCTADGSNGISCTGGFTAGSGGTAAGYINFGAGTAPSIATGFTFYAPASITPYKWKVPAADASGCLQSDGSGNLSLANCSVTLHALYAGNATASPNAIGPDATTTHALFSGGSSADPNFRAIATTDLPAAEKLRSCDIGFGSTSASSALANADLGPQVGICFVPQAATVQEIDVRADGGTPNIIVGVDHGGTVSNLVSAALATASSGGRACSKTTGVAGIDGTTCSATLQNTSVAAGDYIQAVSGTAGGTAKWMTVHVVYSIN